MSSQLGSLFFFFLMSRAPSLNSRCRRVAVGPPYLKLFLPVACFSLQCLTAAKTSQPPHGGELVLTELVTEGGVAGASCKVTG